MPGSERSTSATEDDQEIHRLFDQMCAAWTSGDAEAFGRVFTTDVAIVHTLGSVLMPWRKKLPRGRLSRQTIVAVRTDDGWRYTAFQNSRVRPRQIPPPDSFPSRASQALTRLAQRLGVGGPSGER